MTKSVQITQSLVHFLLLIQCFSYSDRAGTSIMLVSESWTASMLITICTSPKCIWDDLSFRTISLIEVAHWERVRIETIAFKTVLCCSDTQVLKDKSLFNSFSHCKFVISTSMRTHVSNMCANHRERGMLAFREKSISLLVREVKRYSEILLKMMKSYEHSPVMWSGEIQTSWTAMICSCVSGWHMFNWTIWNGQEHDWPTRFLLRNSSTNHC